MNMREKAAWAIYDKATRFDGDEIAVHLGNSMMIDGSAVDAEDLKRIVMQVCEDAADAVLDALMEPTEGMLEAAGGAGAINLKRAVFISAIRAAKEGK